MSLRAKTALAEAARSLEILRGRCHEVKAEWDAHDRKHNFMTIGSMFHEKPEITNNSRVEQQGLNMLASLKAKFANLDELTRSEIEKRLLEAKHVAIAIESLARKLEGPPAPFR